MQTSVSFDHGLGLEVYNVTYPEAAPPRIKVHEEPTRRSARLAAKEQERMAKLSFVKKAMEEARIKSSEDMRLATLSNADRAKQILAAMMKARKDAYVAWQGRD